jgi:hypothetical protein
MAEPDPVLVEMVVLLWAREARRADLADYEDRVLALLPDHGGEVVARAIVAAGDGPDEVQHLRFPSPSARDAFLADPRRTALADVRDAAIARTDVLDARFR